jgi:hypothetical protein
LAIGIENKKTDVRRQRKKKMVSGVSEQTVRDSRQSTEDRGQIIEKKIRR